MKVILQPSRSAEPRRTINCRCRSARGTYITMPNPFDLTGKTALVTGASRGLGQQFARALAGAGADLAITSRTLRFARTVRRRNRSTRPPRRLRRAQRPRPSEHRSRRRRRRSPARPHRHPRQQRRLQHPQAGRRRHVGRLEHDPRHQPPRHVLRRPGRRPAHDPAPLRPHHQHRLGHVRRRLRRPRPVRRKPRRREAAHDEPRPRLGPARHHRQLPRPRLVQDRAKPRALRR